MSTNLYEVLIQTTGVCNLNIGNTSTFEILTVTTLSSSSVTISTQFYHDFQCTESFGLATTLAYPLSCTGNSYYWSYSTSIPKITQAGKQSYFTQNQTSLPVCVNDDYYISIWSPNNICSNVNISSTAMSITSNCGGGFLSSVQYSHDNCVGNAITTCVPIQKYNCLNSAKFGLKVGYISYNCTGSGTSSLCAPTSSPSFSPTVSPTHIPSSYLPSSSQIRR